jgi:hypothetical protein
LRSAGGHLIDERAGDDHHVGLARRGTEHDAVTVEVQARGACMHHSTAQQARPKVIGHIEPVRAQFHSASMLVVT